MTQPTPPAVTLAPCPFCGGDLDFADDKHFECLDTSKWGYVACGCGARGPDVRTGYKPISEWKAAAAAEWNRRAHLRAPEVTALCVECGQQVVSPRPAESAAATEPISTQVMNPPADEAEAGNLANSAPLQSDPADQRRGMTGVSSGSEARPVTATEQSKSLAKRIAAQRGEPPTNDNRAKPDWGNRE